MIFETLYVRDEAASDGDPRDARCVWRILEAEYCVWETGCGEAFQFFPEMPTPVDNGFRFCPYCGRSIVVSDWRAAEGVIQVREGAPPPEVDVRRMREE